jgi:uncharacterized protein (TIGR03546 family)
LLKPIGKLIVALNGNVKRTEIAAGIAWGVLLGLIPAANFFWMVLFMVSFFFRNNHGAKIFAMALVKLVSPLIVFSIDHIGCQILHTESLQPIFTTLYNMPFVPFTRFYNTLVMGGTVLGLLLWLPVFLVFLPLIPLYRNHISPKIRNSKLIKTIGKSPLLKVLDKYISK